MKRVAVGAVLAQQLLIGFANAEALPRTQFTLLNPKADPALCSFASHPLQILSCEGVAGWRIAIGFLPSGSTVTITRKGSSTPVLEPMDGRTVQIANVAIDGPRVAWRGLQRGKLFEPYAVIVRVQVLDPKSGRAFVEPGLQSEPPKHSNVLIVYRLGSEGVCPVAYIDAQTNLELDTLARRAADEIARKVTCPVVTIRVLGAPSLVLDNYISRER